MLNTDIPSFKALVRKSHFTKNLKSSMIIENLELRISDANQIYILDAFLELELIIMQT